MIVASVINRWPLLILSDTLPVPFSNWLQDKLAEKTLEGSKRKINRNIILMNK